MHKRFHDITQHITTRLFYVQNLPSSCKRLCLLTCRWMIGVGMWKYFLLAKYYCIKSIYRFTYPKDLDFPSNFPQAKTIKTCFPRVHDQRSPHSTFFRHDVRKWVGNPPVQDIPDWSRVRVHVCVFFVLFFFFFNTVCVFLWLKLHGLTCICDSYIVEIFSWIII